MYYVINHFSNVLLIIYFNVLLLMRTADGSAYLKSSQLFLKPILQ